ncbi:Phosphoesterase PHP [Minicystis rosea]|nr:Phosphoesterase PHP [Minicystis rosea]
MPERFRPSLRPSRLLGGSIACAAAVLGLLAACKRPAPDQHPPPAVLAASTDMARVDPAGTASPSGTPSASASPSGTPTAAPSASAASGPPRFDAELDVSTFQKGNIHTHTTWSDGDHPPQDVYGWYRDHGYNFLAITDHNSLTDPAVFRLLERKKRFVMITGEEVTMWGAGKQVHVNAICHSRTIGGKKFDTQREALTWGVAQVRAQGGVALVNHPNWDWALVADDLPSAHGAQLLEIASGHPYVHTLGDETHLSHEAIWDWTLTHGETFAAAAVDDAHAYSPRAPDNAARPGRAWIQVFAPEPTKQAICEALGAGKLYASTGVTLKRIVVKDDTYAVYPAERSAKVTFVGKAGAVLQEGKAGDDGAARYKLKGGEGYVRARITNDAGKHAWTQASHVIG